jgi:hypothetical protein
MSVTTPAVEAPPALSQPLYGASIVQAITRFFKKYATFSGRASRSEFWWAYLAYVVVGAAAPSLERLAASSDAGTAAAARLALGRADLAAGLEAVRAVAALLPPGATGQDARRDVVASHADARGVAELGGTPLEQRADGGARHP